MSVDETFFKIENQWNLLFFPRQPNGFAVFIIGDHSKSVEESSSIWHQHPERFLFIQALIKEGYTIFTSQLFGRHWGSKRAVDYSEQLYHLVYKRALLNKKIHLIAEGSGALVSQSLIKRRPELIRSVLYINPCLDLLAFAKQEEHNKLYYKRFIREFAQAHSMEEDAAALSLSIDQNEFNRTNQYPPIHIIHDVLHKRFPFDQHSRPFTLVAQDKEMQVTLSLHGGGKTFSSYIDPACRFFKKHETNL